MAPPLDTQFDHLPTREGYDRWASIYDDEQNPLVAIEEPLVTNLLGDGRGLAIADLGCGTGRHALRLAAAGAQVTALDFSDQMLSKARAKWSMVECELQSQDAAQLQSCGVGRSATIRFVHHDLLQSLPLDNNCFDRVLCSLVVDHISDLPAFFSEMKRVCKPHPDGAIIISSIHPTMMLRGVRARFTDPHTGRETRPSSFPHLISDYVMAAMHAGLAIEHMSEHAVDEDLAKRCPRAEKYIGWPILLLMRLVQPSCQPRYSSV